MATAPKLRATTPGAQGNPFGVPVDNTDYRAVAEMERARPARWARANPMMPGAGQPTRQVSFDSNAGRAVAPNGMGYAPPQPPIGPPMSGLANASGNNVPATIGGRAVAPNGMGYAPPQPQIGTPRFMGNVERVYPTPATVGGAARAATAGASSALARGALARGAMAAGRVLTGPVGAALGTVVPALIDAADDPAGYRGEGLGGYSAHTAAPAGPAGYRGEGFSDPRIVTPAPQIDPNAMYRGMTPANAGPVAPRPVARRAARPAARPVAAAAPQQLFAPGVGDDSRARAMQYLRDQGLLP